MIPRPRFGGGYFYGARMNEWPKTKKEALESGAIRFCTGRPCKNGHIAPRYLSGGCEICERERHKTWRDANPEKSRSAAKAWRVANREKSRADAKAWRTANLEKSRASALDRQKNSPEKARAKSNARRARKLHATPSWLTAEQELEIQQKYLLAKLHELVTGMRWHVDHIVPLKGKKVCGLHVPWNLQVIPAKENYRKHAKFEDE